MTILPPTHHASSLGKTSIASHKRDVQSVERLCDTDNAEPRWACVGWQYCSWASVGFIRACSPSASQCGLFATSLVVCGLGLYRTSLPRVTRPALLCSSRTAMHSVHLRSPRSNLRLCPPPPPPHYGPHPPRNPDQTFGPNQFLSCIGHGRGCQRACQRCATLDRGASVIPGPIRDLARPVLGSKPMAPTMPDPEPTP